MYYHSEPTSETSFVRSSAVDPDSVTSQLATAESASSATRTASSTGTIARPRQTRAAVQANSLYGLPITPPVALRRLFEQVRDFAELSRKGVELDLLTHFRGPICPPSRSQSRAMGDPVVNCLAEYASRVATRAGVFETQHFDILDISEGGEIDREYHLATRALFTFEHAIGVELAKIAPTYSLYERENAARAVLGLGAYWYHRTTAIIRTSQYSHQLLGDVPEDKVDTILYKHALAALDACPVFRMH